MTREDYIHAISARSDRYGDKLIALKERNGVTSLRDITAEQAKNFFEEIRRTGETCKTA